MCLTMEDAMSTENGLALVLEGVQRLHHSNLSNNKEKREMVLQ